MKNLKISTKLLVSFGGIIAVVILLGIVSFSGLNNTNQMVQLYAHRTVPNAEDVGKMGRSMASVQQYLAESIAADNQKERVRLLEKARTQQRTLAESITHFNENPGGARSLMKEYEMQLIRAEEYQQKILDILMKDPSKKNEKKVLELYRNEYGPVYERASDALTKVAQNITHTAKNQGKQADGTVKTSRWVILGVWLVSILFTMIMILLIRRSILQPLGQISVVVNGMSKGKLSTDMDYRSKDELGVLVSGLKQSIEILQSYIWDIDRAMGQMASSNFDISPTQPFLGDFKQIETSISKMIVQVSAALGQISVIAEEVSDEADQVSAYAQSLAQGTEEQASAVEELSASIKEISEQIKRNAEDAQRANSMVTEAEVLIKNSNERMQILLQSMREIDDRSQGARKINNTIEDIAFQTNILALNAAVEAAHAGAAGSGFAVVANEVRDLASRSAEAAHSTASLIEDTVSASNQGVRDTEAAADQLIQAVTSVLNAADIIEGVTVTSGQQSDAVEQINQGLAQVSSVIQTNSASSQESAAASEELSGQAELLKSLVGQFTLKEININSAGAIPDLEEKVEKTYQQAGYSKVKY